MGKLPTSISDTMPTPTPQRRVQGYESQAVPEAMYQAGQSLERDAAKIQQKVDRDAVLEAQKRANEAQRKVLDVLYGSGDLPGIYSAKGADALNSEKTFSEKYKTIREQALTDMTNPVARQALEKQLADLELSNLDNVKRYEMGERKGYATSLAAANEDLAIERVGLEWNNDKTMAEALKTAESSAMARAKMSGYAPGDAAWNETIRGAKSKVISTRLSSMLNQNDPSVVAEAARKYEKFRDAGDMSFDDVNRLDTQFDAALPRARAYEALGKFKGGQVLGSLPQGKVFQALLQVESGARQFDDKGNVIISPKGAVGIAQIMPETGPDAAKAAGLPWDENRFKTDEAYNRQLGEAYYNVLQNKYNDPSIAALAYNWGMGNVDKHIEKVGNPLKGEVSMDYFLSTVPSKEARQYVPKVQAAAGVGGRAGLIDADVAQAYSNSLADVKEREEFLKLVKQQNEAFTAERDGEIKTVMDEALTAYRSSGGSWDAVPNSVRSQAMELGIYDAMSKYNGQSNPSTLSYLYSLPADELAKTDLNTPGIRLTLSEADYAKWEKKKNKLSDPAVAVTEKVREDMVSEAFTKRGIDVRNSGKKAVENQARVARVHDLIDLEVDAFAQNNNGRYPNAAEMQQMVDAVFVKGKYDETPGTAWNPFNWGGKKDYIFEINIEDIPQNERKIIEAGLVARGIPVTDSRVVRQYLLAQAQE